MSSICPSCGIAVDRSLTICPSCGTTLRPAPAEPPAVDSTAPPASSGETPADTTPPHATGPYAAGYQPTSQWFGPQPGVWGTWWSPPPVQPKPRRARRFRWREALILFCSVGLTVAGLLILLYIAEPDGSWTPDGSDDTATPAATPTGAALAPTDADLRELRRLLDGLMGVNRELPEYVRKPLPELADRAARWGDDIRTWKDSFDADPETEALAAAGMRFAGALAGWARRPDKEAALRAYHKAWEAWDKVDDTWETASE
jgi:hypothetical protein